MKPLMASRIEFKNPTLARKLESQCWFITDADVDGLIAIDRHMLVLVRCNASRFLCPVDCVKHLCGIIDKSDFENGGDYVRDVSLPVNVHVS